MPVFSVQCSGQFKANRTEENWAEKAKEKAAAATIDGVWGKMKIDFNARNYVICACYGHAGTGKSTEKMRK